MNFFHGIYLMLRFRGSRGTRKTAVKNLVLAENT